MGKAQIIGGRVRDITFGVDDDSVSTDPVGKWGIAMEPGSPKVVAIACEQPPTSQDFIFDIQYSPDKGVTWISIFPVTSPPSLGVYHTTDSGAIAIFTFAPHTQWPFLAIFRISPAQSGGASGISCVLEAQ